MQKCIRFLIYQRYKYCSLLRAILKLNMVRVEAMLHIEWPGSSLAALPRPHLASGKEDSGRGLVFDDRFLSGRRGGGGVDWRIVALVWEVAVGFEEGEGVGGVFGALRQGAVDQSGDQGDEEEAGAGAYEGSGA